MSKGILAKTKALFSHQHPNMLPLKGKDRKRINKPQAHAWLGKTQHIKEQKSENKGPGQFNYQAGIC